MTQIIINGRKLCNYRYGCNTICALTLGHISYHTNCNCGEKDSPIPCPAHNGDEFYKLLKEAEKAQA